MGSLGRDPKRTRQALKAQDRLEDKQDIIRSGQTDRERKRLLEKRELWDEGREAKQARFGDG